MKHENKEKLQDEQKDLVVKHAYEMIENFEEFINTAKEKLKSGNKEDLVNAATLLTCVHTFITEPYGLLKSRDSIYEFVDKFYMSNNKNSQNQ